MTYARGKYALGICDRCGWQCAFLEMKKEWNGLKVCEECYEPKQPQLMPTPQVSDPEALFEPRPEVSLPRAQLGVITTEDPNPQISTTDDIIGHAFGTTSGNPFKMTGEIGTLSVNIP